MRNLVGSSDVVHRFMNKGMNVTPAALEMIGDISESDVEEIFSNLNRMENRPSIVTDEIISQILSHEETITSSGTESEGESSQNVEAVVSKTESGSGTVTKKEENVTHEIVKTEDSSLNEDSEALTDNVKVLKDITEKSTTEGKVEDFVQFFRDRFEKLSSIVRSREGFQNYTELDNVTRHEGDMVNLVGIVNSKRETRKKDAWIIELEDFSGKAVIYVKDSKRNEEAVERVKKVVTDEIIGVKAKVPNELRSGSRDPLVWGNKIVWPDIPLSGSSSFSACESEDSTHYAVLISDLHVGSGMFLTEVFEKFLNWLNGVAGSKKQRELAEKVKYMVIAGDLVDGIGIYPGQQKELEIKNINDQYKKVAELLSRVPDDIQIIASPGNHDAVRLAEPQPALHSEVTAPLREIGLKLVGNPVLLSIEGVNILVYHGMGFDDLISADPDLDRGNVVLPMEEALRRRHLAPIYGEPMGGRTPFAPEKEDYLVIDEVPDVLHCGHLHRYGCGEYRGVLMINSATFQGQTVFMKRQGIDPTPGQVPIINLKTKEPRAINFA